MCPTVNGLAFIGLVAGVLALRREQTFKVPAEPLGLTQVDGKLTMAA